MKNRILFLLTLLSWSLFSWSQTVVQSSSATGFASANEATQMASQIVKAAGRQANFTVAEARVSNALAVIHDGKRYILYNPDFINALTTATGTRWAAISVLAHEIGHHLNAKPDYRGRVSLSTELEADEFSGYVLEKMGATLDEAQAAMKLMATNYPTATHPARMDRIASIAAGWKQAGGIVREEDRSPAIADRASSTPLPEDMIAARIYFTASPETEYYVTKKLNVLSVSTARTVALIGRITKTDDTDFPYMLYDGSGYRLYVNTRGAIYSTNGKAVGQLRPAEE